tara:strand:+ start:3416 stop:4792 length:1377 start_codon:yes stop_codon:yes gene_type:complete
MSVNSVSKNIMFEFFETIYDKSDLFKLKNKINKIKEEFNTNKNLTDKNKEKKEQELKVLEINLVEQRKKSASGEIRDWINTSVNNAISLNANSKDTAIAIATHVAKLTHSSINWATSIFHGNNDKHCYLSTSSFKELKVDVAHPDLKLAPISKFLLFLHNKKLIGKTVKAEDFSVFKPFSVNNQEFEKWKDGFFLYCTQNSVATHNLAKQIYFPVNDKYHLLSPMVSSVLDQEIYDRLNFDKNMNEVRDYKNKGMYHPDIFISYPNKAILKVTASNDSNASISNGKRGGKRYLLPSMPPTWQKILSPPLKQKSLFSSEFEKRSWKSAKELQKYLIKLQNKEFGNKTIRDQVKQHINNIINILFDYVLEIQAMPSGWSEQAKLKEAHALWLDSNRHDQDFQEKRKSGQWQEVICKDFGLWMNSKLSNKDMKLVKFENDKWAKLLQNRLNLFDKGWEETK